MRPHDVRFSRRISQVVFYEVHGKSVLIALEIPDLPDQVSGAADFSDAIRLDDASASLCFVVIADGDDAATARAKPGIHALQRFENFFIAQDMGDGVVGRENNVKPTRVMSLYLPHVADRKRYV